jgi:hypothetical protein
MEKNIKEIITRWITNLIFQKTNVEINDKLRNNIKKTSELIINEINLKNKETSEPAIVVAKPKKSNKPCCLICDEESKREICDSCIDNILTFKQILKSLFQKNQAEIKRFHDYCETIAKKTIEFNKIYVFLKHFKTHVTELLEFTDKFNLGYKGKWISLINFAMIASHMLDEPVTILECIEALENHHKMTKNFSVNENGEVKNLK